MFLSFILELQNLEAKPPRAGSTSYAICGGSIERQDSAGDVTVFVEFWPYDNDNDKILLIEITAKNMFSESLKYPIGLGISIGSLNGSSWTEEFKKNIDYNYTLNSKKTFSRSSAPTWIIPKNFSMKGRKRKGYTAIKLLYVMSNGGLSSVPIHLRCKTKKSH